VHCEHLRVKSWDSLCDLLVVILLPCSSMYRVARPALSWRNSRIGRRLWNHSRYFSKSSTCSQQSDRDDFDFGDYSVILPAEPYVFGVSHVVPRTVPPNIVRPDYALLGSSNDTDGFLTGKDDGKIVLGGEEEFRLREAAKLAKKVREYARELVQVR
jgi:methionyl aminopeptidase